jgi:hypothetical protein
MATTGSPNRRPRDRIRLVAGAKRTRALSRRRSSVRAPVDDSLDEIPIVTILRSRSAAPADDVPIVTTSSSYGNGDDLNPRSGSRPASGVDSSTARRGEANTLLDAIDDLVQAQVRGDIENFGESGTSNPTQPLGIIRTYH